MYEEPPFLNGVSETGLGPGEPRTFARLEVRDHGRGIPQEEQERIFQRFQQVHPNDQVKGFGLGLYVCRQIVELHGGTIGVQSAEDDGARFVVTLPVEARVTAAAAD
jgi:signal transduction histidine kinase